MKITNKTELDAAIKKLEANKIIQEQEMVSQFRNTVETFKPVNILKSVVGDFASKDVISSVFKTAGSIGISLLTTKLLGSAGTSSAKKILGSLLQQTVSQTAINNVDKIKAYGTAIFHNLFSNKKKNV